ncbi:DUF6461 domain-containing protein [Streptacidiphilus sp. EB129]|uniref:DUF6461 domain-containing protein n=1 Tax=Streptacidiphilus sp. EB129 TaxID=3156262 RepID=UPI003513BCFB
MAADAEARFAWVDELEEDYILPTVSLVEGVAEDEVIRRLGGLPASARPMTVLQALDRADESRGTGLIGVGTLGDLVFTVEGSYTTAVPGILRDLSRGGRAFSVSIDVNGGDRLGYAVDGDLVVFEEHWGPINALREGDPRWDPGWCRSLIDVEDETEIWGVKIFALMERVMGGAVQPHWFTDPLRTVEVPAASRYANTSAWEVP